MTMLWCKHCYEVFEDDDEGAARDQLDQHVADEHQSEYSNLYEEHFVGDPGEIPDAIQTLTDGGRDDAR